jgi:3-deoxy-D-manno-octulosonate 8-phosphate phosphatase (KDO 8-P phosphatase)
MREAGLAIAVANAHPLVKQHADWTTERPGGSGAVREVCELILRAQGKLDDLFGEYLR